MPSVSKKQPHYMGAELDRKRVGKATKTSMSEGQLVDFATTPTKGLPSKVQGTKNQPPKVVATPMTTKKKGKKANA